MNLIDDHHPDVGQHGAAMTSEQQLERLRGGHQQMWWASDLPVPLRGARIPVPARHSESGLLHELGHSSLDVPVQGAERSDVDGGEWRQPLLEDTMDQGEHHGLGLSGSRWGDEHTIMIGGHVLERRGLDGRRLPSPVLDHGAKALIEPEVRPIHDRC